MSTDRWYKIVMIGMDPMEGMYAKLAPGSVFKDQGPIELEDPFMVKPVPTEHGMQMAVIPMAKTNHGSAGMIPPEGNQITVMASAIMWYAPVDPNDQDLKQIVMKTFHGIDIATRMPREGSGIELP